MEAVAGIAFAAVDCGKSSGNKELIEKFRSDRPTCTPEEMRPVGVVMLPREVGVNGARIPYPYVAHKSVEKGDRTRVSHVITASRIAQNLRLVARIKATDDPIALENDLQTWLDEQVVRKRDCEVGLPGESTVEAALITIASPGEPPRYYMGRLTYPRYFVGSLAVKLRDVPDEIRLRVPLFRTHPQRSLP
jgi:hypothetical protein